MIYSRIQAGGGGGGEGGGVGGGGKDSQRGPTNCVLFEVLAHRPGPEQEGL